MIATSALILSFIALAIGAGAGWLTERARRRDGTEAVGFARYTHPGAAYRAVVQALNEMGEGLVIIENERFTFVNDALCRLCGQSRDELLAWPSFSALFYGDENDRILSNHRRRLAGERFSTRYQTLLKHRDGSAIDVEISISVLRVEERLAAVVAIRDIRDRNRAEQELVMHRDRLQELVELRTAELALEKELAQITLASIADAVVTTDQAGLVTYLSPAAEQLAGWSSADARGKPLAEVIPLRDELSRALLPSPAERCLQEGGQSPLDGQCVLLTRAGVELAVELSAAPIHDSQGLVIGSVIVLHDVSEQRRLTQKLTHQATHDALTGLVNRAEFEQRLRYLVDDAHRENREHALCYVDLDQFKIVNDTCGHAAGDELLRQLSHVLRGKMRAADTLARLGGDEFGILLEGCPLDRAETVAHTLLEAVGAFQFAWDDKRFTVGASIGLVAVTGATRDAAEVLRAADAACYSAKDSGRHRVHVYQEDDEQLSRRHGEMQWVTRLRKALEQNRFRLYYQPIQPLQGAARTHWEVLIRLEDEDGRMVPPGAFIPAAERYNLMSAIDYWVIRHAIAWYADAQRLGLDPLPVLGVNLSGTTLSDPTLVDFVREALEEFGVPPSALCFEITETATVANLNEATLLISRIRSLGCEFALDDFGIGMSSFAYLKNLPVDYLKIDGNFVKDMLRDPVDEAMVDTINRMAHVLGIRTIAEYVENAEIQEQLAQLGVDFGQGFGIARPQPLQAVLTERAPGIEA